MLIYLFKIEDAEILFRITEVSVGNTLLTTRTNTQVSGPTKVVGEEISSWLLHQLSLKKNLK